MTVWLKIQTLTHNHTGKICFIKDNEGRIVSNILLNISAEGTKRTKQYNTKN